MGSTRPHEYNWEATWKKSSGSGLEIREYGWKDPSHWPHGTLYPLKLALTSPTSGGRSVSTVNSQTQATEFSFSSAFWLRVLFYLRWMTKLNYVCITFCLKPPHPTWTEMDSNTGCHGGKPAIAWAAAQPLFGLHGKNSLSEHMKVLTKPGCRSCSIDAGHLLEKTHLTSLYLQVIHASTTCIRNWNMYLINSLNTLWKFW
jgi:hypothetical protein